MMRKEEGALSTQPDYDRVFERLEAQIPELVALISQEKQLAAEFSEAVLQLPREARKEKVRNLARVEAWPVAFALLLGALLADEPGKSASLAELAAAAAEAMDDAASPRMLKAGLLGHSHLLRAIGHMATGSSAEGEDALEAAENYLAEATPGGPRARLLCLFSGLRRVRKNLDGVEERFDKLLEKIEKNFETLDL